MHSLPLLRREADARVVGACVSKTIYELSGRISDLVQVTCSRLKLRCTRPDSSTKCERCRRLNFTCSHHGERYIASSGESSHTQPDVRRSSSPRDRRQAALPTDLPPLHVQETECARLPRDESGRGRHRGLDDPVSIGLLTEEEGRRLFEM